MAGVNRQTGPQRITIRSCVLIVEVSLRRPAWWYYPEQCENGHEWAPGRVLVSFTRCDCLPVREAYGETGGLGHLTVACRVSGCTSTWYEPRHEPMQ